MLEVVPFIFPSIVGAVLLVLLLEAKLKPRGPKRLVRANGVHVCNQPTQATQAKRYHQKLWFCPDCPKMWFAIDMIDGYRWKEYTDSIFNFIGEDVGRPEVLLSLFCGSHRKEVVGCLGCRDHHRHVLKCGLLLFHDARTCDMCSYLLLSPVEQRLSSQRGEVVRHTHPNHDDETGSNKAESRDNLQSRNAEALVATPVTPLGAAWYYDDGEYIYDSITGKKYRVPRPRQSYG